MSLLMIMLPALAGILAFTIRSDLARRALLVTTACVHSALTAVAWIIPPPPAFDGWIHLDAPGLLFQSITSVLFLSSAFYAVGYLRREGREQRMDPEEHLWFINAPEAIFTGCLLLFLSTMTLVTMSQHLGVLWVAIEATTLASAPLIYFHRHHRSLEATWKYLMICSVGIALALLGNFFLAVAASTPDGGHVPMVVEALVGDAGRLNPPWLQAAFLLFIVGYGTKMGLAPMHTWLPDAHSEAPSLVSALLSGALLNCAFLGILRIVHICDAAGQDLFTRQVLLVFGLLSMAVAAVFILGQVDYKRMLAYSSIEHMGILALGVGLGGAGRMGALLHAVNHSLTKGMLFLVAGNIMAAYRTKTSDRVQGMFRIIPINGVLWIIGFFAITGTPPFGPFLSELTILKAALDQDRLMVAMIYLGLLGLIFVGMASITLRMAQGPFPGEAPAPGPAESWFTVVPPAILGALVLVLGLYVPPALDAVLTEAVRMLGGV